MIFVGHLSEHYFFVALESILEEISTYCFMPIVSFFLMLSYANNFSKKKKQIHTEN